VFPNDAIRVKSVEDAGMCVNDWWKIAERRKRSVGRHQEFHVGLAWRRTRDSRARCRRFNSLRIGTNEQMRLRVVTL